VKKHHHLLVIGRPSDGENDWMKFTNKTEVDAIEIFENKIREDYGFKKGEREIYLEAVLASESPIEVLQYQQ
jgi:hypothetical protein